MFSLIFVSHGLGIRFNSLHNKFEENGDLGSFTELQVRSRALICAILHGLESEPMFDKVMSEATINGDVNGVELSVPYQLQ